MNHKPFRWLQDLRPDYVQLWEAASDPYTEKVGRYGAQRYCAEEPAYFLIDTPPPDWWTQRYLWHDLLPRGDERRIHVVNDCPDASSMRSLMSFAIARGCRTMYFTSATKGSSGSIYDQLPPYWDQMVDEIKTR